MPFDLEQVVQNALFMVQQKAEGKRIELIVDFDPSKSLHHLVGDPLRLGQILINLLSNAVKFTETGHVRLSVRQQESDQEATNIAFRVEDSGIGMTPEQVGRLFQEFSQADGATTRKYGGTGLGLAISKRLLAAMGSEILVESEIDQGSVFHFSLRVPLAPGFAETPDDKPQIACQRGLVVADYPAVRESMAAMLVAMGCQKVDQSPGGEDALLRLTAAASENGHPYELMLLDWLMPNMSGGELIDALRARGIPLPPKLIVVSSADAVLLRYEANQPEIADVVQKPLLPNVLRRIFDLGGNDYQARLESSVPRPGCLQGMPILLVEDNEVNQQVAGEILKGWGANVEIAANGQIALDRLFSQAPDRFSLVLMDIEMPVMDGREATRRLRNDERFRDLPIIAMTAHVAGHGMKDGLAMGVSGYIAKPFEPDELLAMVQPYWRAPEGPAFSPAELAQENEGEQAFIAAVDSVLEIDSVVLLRRFAGRLPFLAHTLRQFIGDCQNWSERLSETLASGDLETARRQVHTLKGLAGTFAMKRLQAALYHLENAIRSGVVEPFGEIAEVDVQLLPLLAGLERLPARLSEPDADGDDRPIDVVLARLNSLLLEGDGEVEEVWRLNKGRMAGFYSPRQIAGIDHAIVQWNFDEALVILAQGNHGGGGQ